MVARINSGKSIAKALNYNEKKVQRSEAECLHAANFLKDVDQLNFYDKIKHFERLTSLNRRTATNTLHISLNFDPSEKLSNDTLKEIATEYMDQIGFGEQPYIVYSHHDSGHPHIHIVSTNIQSDENRITLHNLGCGKSEIARKEIEIKFGLIKAESRKQNIHEKQTKLSPLKLSGTNRQIKNGITNVLRQILDQYRYTSLPELNAVLGLYSIMADRCDKSSETYKMKGLYYRVLDTKGNKVGTPIKASLFYMKPTLSFLEKKFEENFKYRLKHAKALRVAIDFALLKKTKVSIEALVSQLKPDGIDIVLRRGKENMIYGITYIDHRTKCVFNGSDLGKQYSAAGILEHCNGSGEKENTNLPAQVPAQVSIISTDYQNNSKNTFPLQLEFQTGLTEAEMNKEGIPYPLRKGRKRQRKKVNK